MSTFQKDKISPEQISLLVDASTNPIQIGIPNSNGWETLVRCEDQALEGLFSATEKVLEQSKIMISQVDQIFYCEGPGSTLGLRLAAAFIRTLQWSHPKQGLKVFSFNALDLAAKLAPIENAVIQAPFRIGFRFVRIPDEGSFVSEKKILPEEEALADYQDSYHLPDVRKRSKEVNPKKTLVYDLSNIRGLYDLGSVSKPCSVIVPYNPRAPQFKKWSPRSFEK